MKRAKAREYILKKQIKQTLEEAKVKLTTVK